MTVKELIEKLREFPEDMPVAYTTETWPTEIENVHVYTIVGRTEEIPAVLLDDGNVTPELIAQWLENDRKHQAAMRARKG